MMSIKAMQRNGGSSRLDMDTLLPPSADGSRSPLMKATIATTLAIGICVVGCARDDTSPVSDAAVTDTDTVTTMDPNDILFTTPTLNDAIPATTQGSTASRDCIQVHEDDWRQFEFIPRSRKADVEAELADISAIWDEHSVSLGDTGTAFNEVRVRKRIPIALAIPMSLAEFESFVGQKTRTMTFFGYGEVLRDTHAVAIDNLIVYAEIQGDTITTFGVHATDQFTLPAEFAKRLSDFIRIHDLMLVHWRSRTLLESNEDVMRYFGLSG